MSEVVLATTIPTLRVTKVEDVLRTYAALGFSVAWQHQLSPDAPRLTSVRQGAAELFLSEHPVAPTGAVVYFITQGLDELVARASAAGLVPSFGPEDRPWGTREVYYRDHDGNVLRFGETLRRT
jgi:catechol 2,3-dioxygenase-like lactoylglutathione lyase family enzyme